MKKFAEPYAEILRRDLTTVATRYMSLTNTTESHFSRSATGDSSFFARWKRGEAGFRVQTYDDVMGHLSMMWPTGVPWPEDVPRPAPRRIELTDRRSKKEPEANGEKVEG